MARKLQVQAWDISCRHVMLNLSNFAAVWAILPCCDVATSKWIMDAVPTTWIVEIGIRLYS